MLVHTYIIFISSLFEGVGYLLLLPIIGFLGLSEDAEKTDTNSILDPVSYTHLTLPTKA